MGEATSWVQILATGGVTSLVITIVTIVANRRLTKADTGSKIVQSADVQIDNLAAERDYFKGEVKALREERSADKAALRGWWERAERAVIWMRRQEQRLEEAGIVDPAPDLLPTVTSVRE